MWGRGVGFKRMNVGGHKHSLHHRATRKLHRAAWSRAGWVNFSFPYWLVCPFRLVFIWVPPLLNIVNANWGMRRFSVCEWKSILILLKPCEEQKHGVKSESLARSRCVRWNPAAWTWTIFYSERQMEGFRWEHGCDSRYGSIREINLFFKKNKRIKLRKHL